MGQAQNTQMAALLAARNLARPTRRQAMDALAPKAAPTFTGDFAHTGTKVGLNGKTPVAKAAAITAPTAAGASYNQTQNTSVVTAVNAIRTALTNVGITA